MDGDADVRGSTADAINAALGGLAFLGESLLVDVRWRRHGYAIDLVFNYVWDTDGRIRSNVEGEPWLVTISLEGVEMFTLSGGLTDAMKDSPEVIDWGLSEVARVRAVPCSVHRGAGVAVEVAWEQARSIVVEAVSAAVELPPQLTPTD